jgi:hypothetical protein
MDNEYPAIQSEPVAGCSRYMPLKNIELLLERLMPQDTPKEKSLDSPSTMRIMLVS